MSKIQKPVASNLSLIFLWISCCAYPPIFFDTFSLLSVVTLVYVISFICTVHFIKIKTTHQCNDEGLWWQETCRKILWKHRGIIMAKLLQKSYQPKMRSLAIKVRLYVIKITREHLIWEQYLSIKLEPICHYTDWYHKNRWFIFLALWKMSSFAKINFILFSQRSLVAK